MLIIRIIRSLIKSEDLIDNIGTCLKIEKNFNCFFPLSEKCKFFAKLPSCQSVQDQVNKTFFPGEI